MANKFPKFVRLILVAVALACSGLGHAYTSIATIKNHVNDALYYASNFESQKEADVAALEGCRSEARKNGIGNIAKQCAISLRGKGAGYGALTCGDNGCAYVTGYESVQAAADGAYASCAESFTNCRDKDITNWADFAGFAKKTAATTPASANCRPRTASVRCTSSCNNGNCVVTYENGCKLRVQVSPTLDPFSNQWTYPSPSC